jgi:hypothetical protein
MRKWRKGQKMSIKRMKLRAGDPLVKQIVRSTWPEYTGRKIELQVEESVHLNSYLGEGGTWNEWRALDLAEFRAVQIPLHGGLSAHVAGPGSLEWNTAFERTRVVPGIAYVGRIYFCGKDLGLRIVIHPDNAAKLIGSGE